MVTLWTLSMIELEELRRIVPLERLEELCLAEARRAAPELVGVKGAPFPPSTRAMIYREIAEAISRLTPMTRIALCLETGDLWDRLTDVLVPRRGGRFLCNCGPYATSAALEEDGRERTCVR